VRRALQALHRVRAVEKKLAMQRFAEAERARQRQEDEVLAVEEAMELSRQADALGAALGEAHWIASQHAWRLRLEVDLRRESSLLERRAVDSSRCRAALVEADRESRVVELAIEKLDELEALEARRAEGRRMDELANTRWWRENGP
jgi:hypothetical protein